MEGVYVCVAYLLRHLPSLMFHNYACGFPIFNMQEDNLNEYLSSSDR